MRIVKKTSQSRRDFYAIYECEYCGCRYEGSGYDDLNFHQHVIPNMKCPKCGETSKGQISSHPDVPEGVVL